MDDFPGVVAEEVVIVSSLNINCSYSRVIHINKMIVEYK